MSMFAKLGGKLFVLAAALSLTLATTAFADLASDKALVDSAKVAGTVGEQADGYLGVVSSTDAATTSAVSAINAARAQVYADTASKTGVTLEAAAQATGTQLIDRLPAGQYYKPLGGDWRKK